MKDRMFRNALAVGVILLFIGVAVQPSIATIQPEKEINVEPKDYLFHTIIDIANNPDVKNLLEKYKPDMFKIDVDRSVYRKLLMRNPRLMFNLLFTKPSMSIDYLNKCYNKGIEITNILGEDKVLEIMGTIEPDKEFLNELNNIILNDEELSNRIETLKEIIREIICAIAYTLFILFCILTVMFLPFDIIAEAIDMISNPILEGILILVYLPIYLFFYSIWKLTAFPMYFIAIYLMEEYDCINWDADCIYWYP